jgi:hypothetical protein
MQGIPAVQLADWLLLLNRSRVLADAATQTRAYRQWLRMAFAVALCS